MTREALEEIERRAEAFMDRGTKATGLLGGTIAGDDIPALLAYVRELEAELRNCDGALTACEEGSRASEARARSEG